MVVALPAPGALFPVPAAGLTIQLALGMPQRVTFFQSIRFNGEASLGGGLRLGLESELVKGCRQCLYVYVCLVYSLRHHVKNTCVHTHDTWCICIM